MGRAFVGSKTLIRAWNEDLVCTNNWKKTAVNTVGGTICLPIRGSAEVVIL
jgi:hypothetical protein